MSKMVQIRNMSDDLHRTLKMRAAAEGLSLSDYLLRELEKTAQYPSVEELRRRLASRAPARKPYTTAEWVREGRESR
jgi:plasmid stability protein